MWHPCKISINLLFPPSSPFFNSVSCCWIYFLCLPLLNYLKILSPQYVVCDVVMWLKIQKWSVHAHSKCDCPLSYMHVIEDVNGNIFSLKWCTFNWWQICISFLIFWFALHSFLKCAFYIFNLLYKFLAYSNIYLWTEIYIIQILFKLKNFRNFNVKHFYGSKI